jgi:hypothetical protein
VLYSAKGSALACPVHKTIQRSYEYKIDAAKADADAIENRELDSEEVRRQQQGMAELYSQHPFGKLLVLCFARIHRDTLKGHAPEGGASVTETARELLEKAQKVHAQVCFRGVFYASCVSDAAACLSWRLLTLTV